MSPIIKRLSHAGLAAAIICGAAACAMGPRKSEAQLQADRETVDRVQYALNSDKVLYARHITIGADGGIVDLGGYVWTQPELEEAIRVAESVPGVTKVVDRMQIDRGAVSDSAVSR